MFFKSYLGMSKIKKLIIILFFLLLSNSLVASENNKIKEISEEKYNQLTSLLNNQFLDPRRNAYTEIFILMYYALSNDGKFSSISICDTNAMSDYDCIDTNEKFKTKKSCERISKQRCSVIINKNKLILNGKTFNIDKTINQKIVEYFYDQKIKISKTNIDKKNSTKVIFTGLQSRDLDN